MDKERIELKEYAKGLKVLYVEDEDLIAKNISKVLARYFDVVETASNGKEGLEKFSQTKYDIILSDIRMPVIDGIEMVKAIKKINLDQIIVIISAHDDSDNLVTLIDLGIEKFILKPVNLDTLRTLLHKLCKAIIEKNELIQYREDLEKQIKLRVKEVEIASEQTKKYAFIVNSTNELMSIIGTDYLFQAVNDAYCSVHKKKREEIIGQSVAEIWGEEVFSNIIRPSLDSCFSNRHLKHQNWFKFPDSGKKCFEVAYYPYCEILQIVTHAVVVSRDITEVKKAEETKAQLIQSEKLAALGQLAASIAHDLKQPLNAINMISQLLLLRYNKYGSELTEELEQIFKHATTMGQMIDHINVFSRGTSKMVREAVDMNDIIANAFKLLEPELNNYSIGVRKQLGSNLTVYADPIRLEQVLINLVTNAKDQLGNCDNIKKEIGINSYKKDAHVIVEVKDNAGGITADIREKIFEPFFTTKEVGKGTGLGLSICREIVDEHNGDIQVESSAGETIFKISIPVNNIKLRFGEFLVKNGVSERTLIQKVLSNQAINTVLKLGEMLVSLGHFSAEEIEEWIEAFHKENK